MRIYKDKSLTFIHWWYYFDNVNLENCWSNLLLKQYFWFENMYFILIGMKDVYSTSINVCLDTTNPCPINFPMRFSRDQWLFKVCPYTSSVLTQTDRRFCIFRSGHSWNSGDPSCLLCPLTTLVNKDDPSHVLRGSGQIFVLMNPGPAPHSTVTACPRELCMEWPIIVRVIAVYRFKPRSRVWTIKICIAWLAEVTCKVRVYHWIS